MWYQNIRSALFSFVTIHASDGQTDRRSDGQTELRQQYRALHYMQSHGKNCKLIILLENSPTGIRNLKFSGDYTPDPQCAWVGDKRKGAPQVCLA